MPMTAAVSVPPDQAGVARQDRAGGWRSYLLRRGGGLAISMSVLVTGTFLIIPLLPGDPAAAILGPQATPASTEALRERLNLDDPLYVRFADYIAGLAHLDLGTSFRYSIPVNEVISAKLPYTVYLALWSIIGTLLFGLAMGILVGVATRGGRRAPLALGFGSIAGFLSSIPSYVSGTILIVVFAIWLKVL